jgi:DNA invertase Pin-like site-specific DNA recombinase
MFTCPVKTSCAATQPPNVTCGQPSFTATDLVNCWAELGTRPELTELVRFARNGDTVVIHSMDRLARNLDDLRVLVQGLTRTGVRVEFVKESLVFTGEDSPMANFMLSVMGAFAEFERSLIRERQREGIALAKHRGAYKGRKKTLTPDRRSLRARAEVPGDMVYRTIVRSLSSRSPDSGPGSSRLD